MCTFRSISAWLAAAAVVCGAVSARAADNPRAAFKAANRHFADADYVAASEAYLQAAELAADPANADDHLDPAVPAYNAGLAAFAAGDASAVTNLFATPAPTGADDDLQRQSQIAYNQGCLLYQQAQAAMQQPASGMMPAAQPANAPAPTDMAGAAVEAFKKSVLLDPGNLAAKQNYELALALRQQAMEQQQQQQQQNDQGQNDQDPNQDPQGQNQDKDQQEQGQDENQQEQQEQQQQDGQDQQLDPQNGQEDQEQADAQETEDSNNGEEMTPEEAQMLMDALSDQEQSQRDRLHLMLGRPVPVEKDW